MPRFVAECADRICASRIASITAANLCDKYGVADPAMRRFLRRIFRVYLGREEHHSEVSETFVSFYLLPLGRLTCWSIDVL